LADTTELEYSISEKY